MCSRGLSLDTRTVVPMHAGLQKIAAAFPNLVDLELRSIHGRGGGAVSQLTALTRLSIAHGFHHEDTESFAVAVTNLTTLRTLHIRSAALPAGEPLLWQLGAVPLKCCAFKGRFGMGATVCAFDIGATVCTLHVSYISFRAINGNVCDTMLCRDWRRTSAAAVEAGGVADIWHA